VPEARVAEAKARVLEALPSALYRLELVGEVKARITAHVSGESGLLRLLPGEMVMVEIASYDAGRGRILRKLK
jgi:translation initiation factor IF-1